MQGSLEEDFAALRKLRDDDASGALKEYFWDGEDPREWKHEGGDVVDVAHGRVAMFFLHGCQKLAALPATIGELGALNDLTLRNCSNLAALPAAIGELKALTKLNLQWCSSLTALPESIGELKALTTLDLSYCSSLAALPAAIGELGALKMLNLQGCSNLVALPDTIGELKALTTLDLSYCSSLAALPESIGDLGALKVLDVSGCLSLEKLPGVVTAREGLSVAGPIHMVSGPLAEDFAALRKLRDDDASGALKEFFGDGEDPREWTYKFYGIKKKCVTVADGRVTELDLNGCSSAALPDAIGELDEDDAGLRQGRHVVHSEVERGAPRGAAEDAPGAP